MPEVVFNGPAGRLEGRFHQSATRGAPTSFRLDVYNPPVGTSTPAAYKEAPRFIQSIDNGKMPPSALWGDGVGPNGKAMLQNWKTDGYPD